MNETTPTVSLQSLLDENKELKAEVEQHKHLKNVAIAYRQVAEDALNKTQEALEYKRDELNRALAAIEIIRQHDKERMDDLESKYKITHHNLVNAVTDVQKLEKENKALIQEVEDLY